MATEPPTIPKVSPALRLGDMPKVIVPGTRAYWASQLALSAVLVALIDITPITHGAWLLVVSLVTCVLAFGAFFVTSRSSFRYGMKVGRAISQAAGEWTVEVMADRLEHEMATRLAAKQGQN